MTTNGQQQYMDHLVNGNDLTHSQVLVGTLNDYVTESIDKRTHVWLNGKNRNNMFSMRNIADIYRVYETFEHALHKNTDNTSFFLNEVIVDETAEIRLFFDVNVQITNIEYTTVQTDVELYSSMFTRIMNIVRLYVQDTTKMIILQRSNVSFEDTQKPLKFGFHLVFPDVLLKIDQMKQIAYHVKIDVEGIHTTVVINTNFGHQAHVQLRTVYAFKWITCPFGVCDKCRGLEVVVDKSHYFSRALFVFGDEGAGRLEPVPYELRTFDEFMLTSIRNWRPPRHCFGIGERVTLSNFVQPLYAPRMTRNLRQHHLWRQLNENGLTSRGTVIEDIAIKTEICQVIAKHHEAYKNEAHNIDVLRCRNNDVIVTLRTNGRSYCLFQNDNHTDSRVYFQFTKNGSAFLKCFDPTCCGKQQRFKQDIKLQVMLWPLKDYIHTNSRV